MKASGRLQCLYRQRFGHRSLPWLHGSRCSAPHRGGTGCTHTQRLRCRVQRQLDRLSQDRAASSPRNTVRRLAEPGVKECQRLACTSQKESLDSSSAARRLLRALARKICHMVYSSQIVGRPQHIRIKEGLSKTSTCGRSVSGRQLSATAEPLPWRDLDAVSTVSLRQPGGRQVL